MRLSVQSHNATAPTPAIAPGCEDIDLRRAAAAIATAGMDPRITALLPQFDAPFFQAGLAGYSDAAMRIIARRHGCPYCVTEALLDRTLLAGGRGFDKADLGDLHDNIPGGAADHPLAGQIMGSEPREMAAAALKMVEQKKRTDKEYRFLAYGDASPAMIPVPAKAAAAFDPSEGLGDADSSEDMICEDESCDPLDHEPIDSPSPGDLDELDGPTDLATSARGFEVIDINLACPVKKIASKARGGHWLTEPDGAIRLLQAVRDALPADVPCTVKLRRAFDDTPEMAANFDRIIAAAFDMGYAWATVHARTVTQKYVGPSRWDLLRSIVQRHPSRPIFGSGDVWEASDIIRMIAYTGVSGVSVARGCIGNPWIFRQARDLLAGQPARLPTLAEQREVLEEHFRLSLAVTRRFRHSEETTSRMMRKFAIRFAANHPQADAVRRRFIAVSTAKDWRETLDAHYPL
ncbi:MAG: tRNA-dihydrouridine synthase [Phycisphaerales bacterium]|jgi:tRNA-dihydrouridine synthase